MEHWRKKNVDTETCDCPIGLRRARREQKARRIFFVLKVFLFLIFAGSASMAVQTYHAGKMEQAAFEKLRAVAERAEAKAAAEQEENKQGGYIALYAQNHDFAGWLKIPNTMIDYPVMVTPEEPEYYLYRAFDGTSAKSGTPFIGEGGTVDTDCFIIYGHNMKNDTMFGTLDAYQEETFWKENQYFSFETPDEAREYRIFAAAACRVLAQDEAGFRYYRQAGDLTEDTFYELIQWLLENACYDTGIVPQYGDQIIILSTCSDDTRDGRFIVAAVKSDETERE